MWEEELRHNITTVEELEKYISLTEQEKADIRELSRRFPMAITRHYMKLIDVNNPADPLRKLVIPSGVEFVQEGLLDTSGEAQNTKVNGLQHKYAPTALMLSTNACASYCRFCFRKRMVGLTDNEIARRMDEVAEYIRENSIIDNVLISGGDSLMNSNELIKRMLDIFMDIDSIRYIRFGTRMLSVLPQRLMDEEFLRLMEDYNRRKQIYIITHFDHPREISPEALEAVEKLKKVGVAFKNQTVLLRGVNDNPTVMAELMNRLTTCGISSYYIFQCRPVLGVKKQFQVPFIEGNRIINETRKLLSGPAKQFRYALSHVTGKIEIIGMVDQKYMLFKYHQAKHVSDNSRILTVDVSDGKAWLDEEDVK